MTLSNGTPLYAPPPPQIHWAGAGPGPDCILNAGLGFSLALRPPAPSFLPSPFLPFDALPARLAKGFFGGASPFSAARAL